MYHISYPSLVLSGESYDLVQVDLKPRPLGIHVIASVLILEHHLDWFKKGLLSSLYVPCMRALSKDMEKPFILDQVVKCTMGKGPASHAFPMHWIAGPGYEAAHILQYFILQKQGDCPSLVVQWD